MDSYYDSGIWAVIGGFIFVIAIVAIIMYVFNALGLQAMAKKLNIENPWLAWIPVANAYLVGKIAGDQVTIFKNDIKKLGIVLLVGSIIVVVISAIPVIGTLAGIAYAVIYFVALYKIYRIFAENNAVMYIVLSIIISVTAPFFIYFSSKNEPNMTIFNEGKYGGYRETPAAPVTPVAAAQAVIPESAPEPVSEPAPEPEAVPEPAPEPVQPEAQPEEKIEE